MIERSRLLFPALTFVEALLAGAAGGLWGYVLGGFAVWAGYGDYPPDWADTDEFARVGGMLWGAFFFMSVLTAHLPGDFSKDTASQGMGCLRVFLAIPGFGFGCFLLLISNGGSSLAGVLFIIAAGATLFHHVPNDEPIVEVVQGRAWRALPFVLAILILGLMVYL